MRVVILMSTYQGERFVTDQLSSILTQLPEGGRILIRDDGSSDQTVVKIEALCDARIEIIRGSNVGFARSFLSLMDAAPADADMFMLADQDDIWMPEKIERAASYLESIHNAVPALYCSRLHLVDVELKPIGLSPAGPERPSFECALTENIVIGCTAAFNRAALDLVRRHGDISLIYFHDWWLYLVVAAFGVVHFDPEPTALYRQHGANVLGMGAGLGRYWTIVRFLGRKNFVHIMFNQIENFRAVHIADMRADQSVFIERYFDPRNPRSVFRFLLSPRRHKQRLLDEFLLRGMVVLAIVSGRGLLPKRSKRK